MLNKRSILISALLIVSSSFFLSACSIPGVPSFQAPSPTPISFQMTKPTATPSAQLISAAPTKALNNSNDTIVSLNTKSGQIVIKLYKDTPKTTANFIQKVKSGFYNNLTFHRVEADFVVQGGDPRGDSTGGGSMPSELTKTSFKRGSVGMARGPNREISNDSQFFICLNIENCSSLSGDYVNFGEVVYGMDIVDKINVGDKINSTALDTK